MFKKGQLVRGIISSKHYVVLQQHGVLLAVKDISDGNIGWMNSRYVTLIGNNFKHTAKDSKESAPANLGS